MRVCVIAEYYPRPHDPVSGIWAHRQAQATQAAGADVRVLVLDRPVPPAAIARDPRAVWEWLRRTASAPRRVTLDGIDVEYVRYVSPPRERAYAAWHRWARRPLERALERLERASPLDLVHAHYALPAGAAARSFAATRRLPLAVSVHGGDVLGPLTATPAARATAGATLRGASVVLCNSNATLRRARMLAGRDEHMRVVHLGTDVPAALPPKASRPTLATLAYVDPRKRHVDVLRALALLTGDFPRLAWRVIGSGPELPRLRALAAELGVAERVEFTGQLEPTAALDALARCHVMAMPSLDEAFGVAYVEALARGLATIGSAGEGGPEEIAALGPGMRLVPPCDPEALAAELRGLLPQAELVGAQGRETAARHFSWEACGQATVAAYRTALA